MIRRFLFAVALLCAGGAALAQQTQVAVVIEEDQVLAHEDLVVAVKISNFSGRTLKLGQDNRWLRFFVTAEDERPVEKFLDPPVEGEFEVASSQMATRRVNIAPFFSIGRPGAYRVTAIVKLDALGVEQMSDGVSFSVVSGRKLWEQEFGLGRPGAEETRRYSLIQSTHKERLMLYARVEDVEDHRVLRTVAVSGMTSFNEPQALVDREGFLHVLCQFGARSANHSIVDPHGAYVSRDIYDFSPSRPMLKADPNGKVLVMGGMLRQRSAPVMTAQPPPAEPPAIVTNAPPSAVVVTNATAAPKSGEEKKSSRRRKSKTEDGSGTSGATKP